MYSELIYTRCSEGIELTTGKKNSFKGFKVFACSAELLNDADMDIGFLADMARISLSTLNNLKSDAYLYFVPAFGKRFLLESHAVEPEKNAEGFFSHRGGNFLNQIFVGTFEDQYPFETFGDESIWDAKKRGEAFYYTNASEALPCRVSLASDRRFQFEDVGKFVADGRRNVLMKALAFLIEQYSIPYEKRRYLLIKDKTSTEIKMWISAIECAFSQRIASGISFTTRFGGTIESSNNLYSVNLMGKYNPQEFGRKRSPNSRIKAMIVGIEESECRKPIKESAEFVILDGTTKTLSCEIDAVKPVYSLMTAYNNRHRMFTQGFLQTFDFTEPGEEIVRLFVAFTALERYETNASEEDLSRALSFMLRHRMKKTPYLSELYQRVKSRRLFRSGSGDENQRVISQWMNTVEKVLVESN